MRYARPERRGAGMEGDCVIVVPAEEPSPRPLSSSDPIPRLLSLATVVPRNILPQAEVRAEAERFFGAECQRLLPVFGNTGIEKRHSAMPLAWYREARGWVDRNDAYLRTAVSLLEEVALRALDDAGLAPESIDTLVTVSTTGIATPSLDALLMERLNFRRQVQRLPVFGLGCAGGVLGLSRAALDLRMREYSERTVALAELLAGSEPALPSPVSA